MRKPAAHTKAASPLHLALPLGVALFLAFALGAKSSSAPPLTLGPIVVANGAATVTGNLGGDPSTETLSVNGQPVGVDSGGNFTATVDLGGTSTLDFGITGRQGDQSVDFQVPLGSLVGSSGAIAPGALDALNQAGVSLLTPVTGGKTLQVSGGVLDKGQLSSLTLNGEDVLGQVGSDRTFTVQLPGTTRAVTLRATDAAGNSQTQTLALQHTVSASQAVGVRIVKLRYLKGNVHHAHRLRLVITVKDRLGRLVKGARITVTGAKKGTLVRRAHASRSGAKGKATFGLKLRKPALGKRVRLTVVARTPHAKARKNSSVRLPR
jgi:hypothetical protein